MIQDLYRQAFDKAATSEVLSLCKHELMQAIWLLLLDDERERERILNLYTAASKQKVLRRGATGRRKVTYLGKQSII